jgi:hypothetical protein
MGKAKRKYCLSYLADRVNQTWFGGKSKQKALYDTMVKTLLVMDGLKHTWCTIVQGSFDIAVRYMVAQEILRQVAKQFLYSGDLPVKLPWTQNTVIFHCLVGARLPLRLAEIPQLNRAMKNNVPSFDSSLPANVRFTRRKKLTKRERKPAFSLLDYCKAIKAESEYSREESDGYFVFFFQK